MRDEVRIDFEWQKRFLRELKAIAGICLIGVADEDEDREHNTDLIVLKLDAVRIACRVRRNKYLDRFGEQFTIRSHRDSGAETELAKVLAGWGDYMLYGIADERNERLACWVLIDLPQFRAWYESAEIWGFIPDDVPNGDGTWFKPFQIGWFHPIARKRAGCPAAWPREAA